MKILIVEDEKKTASYLEKGLTENGFVVDVARSGEDGLHLARTGGYDLLVLDVMLPGRDGWSILSALREAGAQTPVLFRTARDSVQDRVKGLDLGAYDYLVKPFAFSELLARVRSVLRRGPSRLPEILREADLELDLIQPGRPGPASAWTSPRRSSPSCPFSCAGEERPSPGHPSPNRCGT